MVHFEAKSFCITSTAVLLQNHFYTLITQFVIVCKVTGSLIKPFPRLLINLIITELPIKLTTRNLSETGKPQFPM